LIGGVAVVGRDRSVGRVLLEAANRLQPDRWRATWSRGQGRLLQRDDTTEDLLPQMRWEPFPPPDLLLDVTEAMGYDVPSDWTWATPEDAAASFTHGGSSNT